MAAAADYLRPFAAQGTSPALLPETHGPDYWTDPGVDRIPAYPRSERAVPSQPGEPPEEIAPPGDELLAGGRWSYFAQDGPPYDDYDYDGPDVVPPRGTYLPGAGQAPAGAGERYQRAGPQSQLQPYGPADSAEPADQQRYPIPDAPYEAGQDFDAPAGAPYTVGPQRYPPAAEQYPADDNAHPAYPGELPSPAGARGEAGYHPVGQPYQASAGYPAPSADWGASSPEDLTGLDPIRYPDPLLYPSTAAPSGPSDPAAAASELTDSGKPAGRGWGAGARRMFRRNGPADAQADDGGQLSGAGLPGQPYAAAPHGPDGGSALATAAPEAGQAGPDAAGAGPAYDRFDLIDDRMLTADGETDLEPDSAGLMTRRPPGQGRWIAFAAAAIVLILAAAGATIALTHRAPPAGHPASGPTSTSTSTSAPRPAPRPRPLVTIAPAAASAPQAPAVKAFLIRYFTAINEHDFAAYRSLFSDTQRGGLSAAAFARGYGSSRDSQATLRSIAVGAAGQLVATVSFVSHQQPADSATHSACTSWTISLFLIKQSGAYVIHTPPAGYGATAAACP